MKKQIIYITAILALIITSCGGNNKKEQLSNDKPTLSVTIPPIKYIIERITENDFKINVIVPNGTGPETYSITPEQSVDIEKSDMIFITGGFDLENTILSNKKIHDNKIINISTDIKLLSGTHNHHTKQNHNIVDPHIWLSPEELIIMTKNALNAITMAYPDSVKYYENAKLLISDIISLQNYISDKIDSAKTEAFIIYHPALSYFAREFSLEQISIEKDGKEPSAKGISELIYKAKKYNISQILIQNEFPDDVVKSISKDMDAEITSINPLSENILTELRNITDVITK